MRLMNYFKTEDILTLANFLKSSEEIPTSINKLLETDLLKTEGYMGMVIEKKDKGWKKGWIKGLQAGHIQVALNMLKKKLDISLITRMTSLPKKEINKLKKNFLNFHCLNGGYMDPVNYFKPEAIWVLIRFLRFDDVSGSFEELETQGLLKTEGYMGIILEIQEKGWKKGWIKGLQAGRVEVTYNMLKKKLSIPLIAEVTDEKEKEIKNFKKKALKS